MKTFRLTFLRIFFFLFFISQIRASDDLANGIELLNDGKYEQAKSFFIEKVEANENNAEANYYLGRAYFMLDDHDNAVDYCEEAIELDDSKADYHFWLANALGKKARHSNVFKQAWLARRILKEFERTIEIDPRNVYGHVGCANFYIHAPSIMGGGLEKARKEAEILLKLSPMQGRILLAAIYEKEEKPDCAEKEYAAGDKSFNDSTDHYRFYNSYGYFLLKQKKYEKAIEMFRKQVKLAPDKANPHDSLGDGLRAAGRITEALAEYKRAIEIDPGLKASKEKIKELIAEQEKN